MWGGNHSKAGEKRLQSMSVYFGILFQRSVEVKSIHTKKASLFLLKHPSLHLDCPPPPERILKNEARCNHTWAVSYLDKRKNFVRDRNEVMSLRCPDFYDTSISFLCFILEAVFAHAYWRGVHMGKRHRHGSAEGTKDGQRATGGGTKSSEVTVASVSGGYKVFPCCNCKSPQVLRVFNLNTSELAHKLDHFHSDWLVLVGERS